MDMCFRILFYIFSLTVISSCTAQVNTSPDDTFGSTHPEKFGEYWYQGEAEITHFNLIQSRYGEERKGDAVLIYVTENFLPDKQVKDESNAPESISVLKLNFLKKFPTGIYDYSLMTSIFTPIDFRKWPTTLKSSFSSQDWCGLSFSQMNLRENRLDYQVRSYFENEGDFSESLNPTYVEEDLWTRLRIEPQLLPMGEFDFVPSLEFIRLNHVPLKAYSAKAKLVLQVNDSKSSKEFYIYTIEIPDLNRVLQIRCESRFPFRVLGWTETLTRTDGKKEVTTATFDRQIKNAYWRNNSQNNKALRDSLGLNYQFHFD